MFSTLTNTNWNIKVNKYETEMQMHSIFFTVQFPRGGESDGDSKSLMTRSCWFTHSVFFNSSPALHQHDDPVDPHGVHNRTADVSGGCHLQKTARGELWIVCLHIPLLYSVIYVKSYSCQLSALMHCHPNTLYMIHAILDVWENEKFTFKWKTLHLVTCKVELWHFIDANAADVLPKFAVNITLDGFLITRFKLFHFVWYIKPAD